jgi:hypothetical protein
VPQSLPVSVLQWLELVKALGVLAGDPALVVELDDALGVAELLSGKAVAAGPSEIGTRRLAVAWPDPPLGA